MDNLINIEIDKIIYNGYSIGKYNGITIFTRWGVPGDIVKVEIKKKKKNYYEGEIVDLLEKSPYRIESACPYFGLCGGCQLQNIDYKYQLKIKEDFIQEALKRYKTTKKIRVKPIISPPNIIKYRNKAQIPFKDGSIGLYSMETHNIVEIADGCLIQDELINENIRILSKINKSKDFYKHISHIILRRDIRGVYVIVVLDEIYDNIPIIKDLKNVVGVYENIKKNPGNRIMGDKFIHYSGEKFLRVTYFDEVFDVYPWCFLQVNDRVAEMLYKNTMESLQVEKQSVVLDGYSGVGILSLLMSSKAKRIISIEYDAMSVVSLGVNMQKRGIDNIKLFQGDIEKVLVRNRGIKFNKVILDPPKKGLTKMIINEIIKRKPERIVYISCNPQTLVRDIDRFINSYEYKCLYIQPFDLFPQTFHMENIAIIDKV